MDDILPALLHYYDFKKLDDIPYIFKIDIIPLYIFEYPGGFFHLHHKKHLVHKPVSHSMSAYCHYKGKVQNLRSLHQDIMVIN